jgi:hypothetical protein
MTSGDRIRDYLRMLVVETSLDGDPGAGLARATAACA